MTDDIQQFDFNVDLLKAILWEYNNAARLQSLLNQKQAWYDENQQSFWESWIVNVFDLRTANKFGLEVWSIILNLPLYVNTSPSDTPIFGFDDQTGYNFDNGIFGNSGGNTYELPDNIKRIALQLRYFQLTSAGTVPEINRMLKYVFKDFGQAWLIDNHDMTQVYFFNFALPFDLKYLFNNYDVLPRPAGVASYWTDAPDAFWGFAPGDYNFDNGIFGS